MKRISRSARGNAFHRCLHTYVYLKLLVFEVHLRNINHMNYVSSYRWKIYGLGYRVRVKRVDFLEWVETSQVGLVIH